MLQAETFSTYCSKLGTLDIFAAFRGTAESSGEIPAISDLPHARRTSDHRFRKLVVRCGASGASRLETGSELGFLTIGIPSVTGLRGQFPRKGIEKH